MSQQRLPEWRYIVRRCVVTAIIVIIGTMIWNITGTTDCSVYGCGKPATLPETK